MRTSSHGSRIPKTLSKLDTNSLFRPLLRASCMNDLLRLESLASKVSLSTCSATTITQISNVLIVFCVSFSTILRIFNQDTFSTQWVQRFFWRVWQCWYFMFLIPFSSHLLQYFFHMLRRRFCVFIKFQETYLDFARERFTFLPLMPFPSMRFRMLCLSCLLQISDHAYGAPMLFILVPLENLKLPPGSTDTSKSGD